MKQMKKLSQAEWTDLHNKAEGGIVRITGINMNRDGVITSLEVNTSLSGTLSARGTLSQKYVGGITGGMNRQFYLEEDGSVSIVLGSDEILRNRIRKPRAEINVPIVIPFKKWLADYIAVQNFTHTRDCDKFHEVKITGVELDKFGVVKAVNSDVTWEEVFGNFGRNTSYNRKIGAGDILLYTYGLCRNDICDDWYGRIRGDRHCYFDEILNIVYDGDATKFHYNSGYNMDYFHGYNHDAYRLAM